jgi:hypothetical protein
MARERMLAESGCHGNCITGEEIMKRLVLSALLAAGWIASAHATTSVEAYNGSWNLAFYTQSGTCDPSYNFTVDVSHGLVTHPNLVRFKGTVQKSGLVRASVAVQDKYASGSGRLFGAAGKGTWTGYAGSSRCAGYWTAQKN